MEQTNGLQIYIQYMLLEGCSVYDAGASNTASSAFPSVSSSHPCLKLSLSCMTSMGAFASVVHLLEILCSMSEWILVLLSAYACVD